ncbi:hypothetical protein ACFX13_020709 [Malus domestica]
MRYSMPCSICARLTREDRNKQLRME